MNKNTITEMLEKEMAQYQAEAAIYHELIIKAIRNGDQGQEKQYQEKHFVAWEIVEALARLNCKLAEAMYDEQ